MIFQKEEQGMEYLDQDEQMIQKAVISRKRLVPLLVLILPCFLLAILILFMDCLLYTSRCV